MATSQSTLTLSGSSSGYNSNNTSTYDFDTGDFTYGVWFNCDAFTNTDSGLGGTHNNTNGWGLKINQTGGHPSFTVAGVGTRTTSTMACSTGTWYFLAIRVDEGVDMDFVRIDQSGTIIEETEVTLNVNAGTKAFYIGQIGTTSSGIDGLVMYAQFWNRLLTNNEIQVAAFNPGSITNGLIGYWPCHGVQTAEPDLSVTGADATPANGTAVTTSLPRVIPVATFIT